MKAPPPRSPLSTGVSPRREWLLLAGIAVLALVIRIVYLQEVRQSPFFTLLMGDSKSYDTWGQQVAGGDWIGTEVFYQAPLYPYFLGVVYSLFGHDLMAVRVVQSCLGALSCALLAHAAWRLFDRRAGIVAGLMLALYAPAIFFDGLLQKTALDAFLTSVALWIVSGLVVNGHRRGAWFGLGVTMAALSLARENALLLVGVLGLWALLPSRSSNGEKGSAFKPARASSASDGPASSPALTSGAGDGAVSLLARLRERTAPFVAGLALLLLPVAARNAAVGGGFYLTTSQFGSNLYLGNNPKTDGTAGALIAGRGSAEYERRDATDLAERARGRSLTPAEVSSYWTEQTLAFIRSQPGAWLRLMLRKSLLLVNRAEAFDTESQESYAEWSVLLRASSWIGHFSVLVPLAFLGLVITWPARQRLGIFYVLAAAYAASVVMFFIYARYRFPLVPMLIIFAAPGVTGAMSYWRSQTATGRAVLSAATLALVAVTALPLLDRRDRLAVTYHNVGAALQDEGQLDRAAESYRKAIEAKADYAPAYSNLGSVLMAKGDKAGARVAYERALAIAPDFADAHFNLGNALMEAGDPVAAADHFSRVLALAPATPDVLTNLGIALEASGRTADALRELRRALALAPESGLVHRVLGEVLAEHGNVAEASEHLTRAITLSPDDGEAHRALGRLLLQQQNLPPAIEHLRAAARLAETSEAYNDLGIALGSAGQVDEAIAQFTKAVQLDPANTAARQNLEASRRERGVGGR